MLYLGVKEVLLSSSYKGICLMTTISHSFVFIDNLHELSVAFPESHH